MPDFEEVTAAERARRRQLDQILDEVVKAGRCLHPVRIHGSSLDEATGEVWEGTIGIACKDRRAAVCPVCAARYRSDAWHLIASGIRGGKGVPETVASHPMLFVTLTAPSFGPVHAHRDGPCRPRRRTPRCPHGVGLSCLERHNADEPVVGEPVCSACIDYRGSVLWNAHVGILWDHTMAHVRAGLLRGSGRGVRDARTELRLAYVKVAEFQRRGLVHLHAIVRGDGRDGPSQSPPPWCDVALLESSVREAVRTVRVEVPTGAAAVWGKELDVVRIGATEEGPEGPNAIASYLAAYAVKSSETSGTLARRIRSVTDLDKRKLRPHVAALVRTAWDLGADPALEGLRLREHAHTFDYRGHFATASRSYSTTFGALRAVRVAHGRPEDVVALDGWRYSGRGYATAKAARLAEAFLEGTPRSSRRPTSRGGMSGRAEGER